jgi:hypothetical protein
MRVCWIGSIYDGARTAKGRAGKKAKLSLDNAEEQMECESGSVGDDAQSRTARLL